MHNSKGGRRQNNEVLGKLEVSILYHVKKPWNNWLINGKIEEGFWISSHIRFIIGLHDQKFIADSKNIYQRPMSLYMICYDIICQVWYWYKCFWNQHKISDCLSQLWIKARNFVFWSFCPKVFKPRESLNWKIESFSFHQNIISLFASHPANFIDWYETI